MRHFIRDFWFQILVLIGLVLLLLRFGCNDPVKTIKGRPEVIRVDTVETVKHTRDTIVKWSNKVIYRNLPLISTDSSVIDLSDTNEFKMMYYYRQKDSLLDATIMVSSHERPDSVGIEYSVLKESIIDSFTIERTITEQVRVNQLWFGGNATAYPGFNSITMEVDFVHKRGWQVEVGAGWNISNNNPLVTVGYKRLISFRKK